MKENLKNLENQIKEGVVVDEAVVLVSEIMQESEDGHWSEWYNPRTNVVSVRGERAGERHLIWLINRPEGGYPHPQKDLIEWIPYLTKTSPEITTNRMPAVRIDIDGVGFIRQRTNHPVDITSSTTSPLFSSKPSSPSREQKVIQGRQSADIHERTGIAFDLVNGDIIIKGQDSSLELKTGGSIYIDGAINSEDMNATGPLKDNWLGKLLPECLPIFPASLAMLPDPEKLVNMAGQITSILQALDLMRELVGELD